MSLIRVIRAVMQLPVHVQKFLKPLSTSAVRSCRSVVVCVVLASVSDCSFLLTLV